MGKVKNAAIAAQELQTFISNLKYAVANRETVSIGGGDFTPDELRAVIAQINELKPENELCKQ